MLPASDRVRPATRLVFLQPCFALIAIDIVLLHDRGIGDEQPGEDRVIGREWLEQVDLECRGIDNLDRVLVHDGGEHPGHAEVLAQHSLKVVLHRLGGDRRTVVEGRVVGQLDRPGGRIRAADNFGRQERFQLTGVSFVPQQRIVDGSLAPGDGVVMAGVRIEIADVLRAAVDEGVRFRLSAKSQAVERPASGSTRCG